MPIECGVRPGDRVTVYIEGKDPQEFTVGSVAATVLSAPGQAPRIQATIQPRGLWSDLEYRVLANAGIHSSVFSDNFFNGASRYNYSQAMFNLAYGIQPTHKKVYPDPAVEASPSPPRKTAWGRVLDPAMGDDDAV